MTKISLGVIHPGSDLHLIVRLDDQVVWQTKEAQASTINLDLADDDGSHVLEIAMSGKQPHHTKIDSTGQITQDVVVTIHDVTFDDINLGHVLTEKAVYNHNFNNTTDRLEDKFYGTMGCNGTVRLEFTTPIYLWLLENM